MSHKRDIERAKSGTIFRDGKLWSKKDWDTLHPSKQSVAKQQSTALVKVDTELEGESAEKPYFCAKCKRTHKPGSKVYQAHREVADEPSM